MEMDIAVIGMAARYPQAPNAQALLELLRQGKDTVRPVSEHRLTHTGVPNVPYTPISHFDDIDSFDFRFFKISKGEAEFMDPHQRLLLEEAYHCFESAGYNMDALNGSRTAVFLGSNPTQYNSFYGQESHPTAMTGNLATAASGRIARFFNLRGGALMVDTACSSGLVSVHNACNALRLGEADMALVGVASIMLIPLPSEMPSNGGPEIASNDGKTRSFSANATGAGQGESTAFVLLKPLASAQKDNDRILAVVKSTAMNQDAALSGSLTAPSSKAQSEVIQEAWQKADINPETISYIEAHGSATKLGDPTEIGGLELAFAPFTQQKGLVAVSSIKSNLGHTGNAAGLSGFIKAILALNARQHFASVNYDEPNPFIDFDKLPIYVNDTLKDWPANPEHPRRCGVSSFGLSGTNAHAVLEEAPQRAEPQPQSGPWVFTLSAHTATAFARNLDQLITWLDANPNAYPGSVAHTLSQGRSHLAFRHAWVAGSLENLKEQLQAFAQQQQTPARVRGGIQKSMLLFSPDTQVSAELLEQYAAAWPIVAQTVQACRQHWQQEETPDFRRFALQIATYKLMEQAGLDSEELLGLGTGALVVDVALQDSTLEEALQELAEDEAPEVPADFDQRLYKLVEAKTEAEKFAFVEVGPQAMFAQKLGKLLKKDFKGAFALAQLEGALPAAMPQLLQQLYIAGLHINWAQVNSLYTGQSVDLPLYSFEKDRCWVFPVRTMEELDPQNFVPQNNDMAELAQLTGQDEAEEASPAAALPERDRSFMAPGTELEKAVAAMWQKVLSQAKIGINQNFFQIGGTEKLLATLHQELQHAYGAKVVHIAELFDLPTIEQQAKMLAQKVQASPEKAAEAPAAKPSKMKKMDF